MRRTLMRYLAAWMISSPCYNGCDAQTSSHGAHKDGRGLPFEPIALHRLARRAEGVARVGVEADRGAW